MREREARDLEDAHQQLCDDEEVVKREKHGKSSAMGTPGAPERRWPCVFDIRKILVLTIVFTSSRLWPCAAPRREHEEYCKSEEIEPGAERDEDSVEETGRKDVAVEGGDWALL